MNRGKKAKKRLSAPNISLRLDRSEGSLLSDELDESTELDLDGIDTPSDNSNEFEWEGKNLRNVPCCRLKIKVKMALTWLMYSVLSSEVLPCVTGAR